MEKLHDNQTDRALERAGKKLDCLVRSASCDELQESLWEMFQDSLCYGDDGVMPEDILMRTVLYDTFRNIFKELEKVPRLPGHVFLVSYGEKALRED